MKNRILILSALTYLCGATNAGASDCSGAGCQTQKRVAVPDVNTVQVSEQIPPQAPIIMPIYQPVQYQATVPMRQVKLFSVKDVPSDNRPPLWDGTRKNYNQPKFDKTVDPRDGVPIWDDSVSDYTQTDFSDWFLQPLPELYMQTPQTAILNLTGDMAATRARLDTMMTPTCDAPAQNVATDTIEFLEDSCIIDDGCPFDTYQECEIWRRKPISRETVSPRSPKIRAGKMGEFLDAARANPNIDATHPTAAPLVERYKILMRSAQACCTDGLAYSLRNAGASDGLLYKFLADDANFYGLGARCLMMTDAELDTKYPNTSAATVVADVRNGCLCRSRQWFTAMLAPFEQVYRAYPEFQMQKFYYTYTDGLQRRTTVSINNDVQNVLNQLSQCP